MQWLKASSVILLCILSISNSNAENEVSIFKTCAVSTIESIKTRCMLIITDTYYGLVDDIIKLEVVHVFVNTKSKFKLGNLQCTPTLYVILFAELDNYRKILEDFYRTQLWNPRAKFFVIHSGTGILREVFKISWEFFIINLIVLDQSKMYSYFPFENGACGGFDNYQQIYNCESDVYPIADLLFNNSLPVLFNECPVRVLALKVEPYVIDTESAENPGIEILLLREVAARSNLSLTFIKNNFTSWGTKFPDGTYSLMYEELSKRRTDILVGLFMLNISFYYDFEDTMVYNQDVTTFFVPTANLGDGWKNFILVFDNWVWLSMSTTMLVVPISWWIMGKAIKGPHALGGLQDCIFRTFEILFTAHSLPLKNTLLKYLFWMWCAACLILNSAYQTKLTSFLTKPAYERQITTIAEMVQSKLSYGGFPSVKCLMNETGNEVYLTVLRNWIACPLSIECLNRSADQRDFGVFKSVKIAKYLIPKIYTNSDGRPKLFQLKDVLTIYKIHMKMIRGLPYYQRINQLIPRIIENGLFSKWSADIESVRKYKVFNDFQRLGVHHLKIIFLVYIFGNALAFITFLLENGLHRYFKRTRCISSQPSHNAFLN